MSSITQLNPVSSDLPAVTAPSASPGPTSPQTSSAPPASSKTSSTPGNAAVEPKSPPQQANPAQRLVIQAGAQTGVFIYTILDRATGQVLVQIPREEVIQLSKRPDYSAGSVIDTKA
jgi:flagellar protein FlaG